MKSRLNKFPAEETHQLIAEILRKIPQFVTGLQDKTVPEKIYHTIRRYEEGLQYTWYRFQRRLCSTGRRTVTGLVPGGITPYTEEQYRLICLQPTREQLYHAVQVGMIVAMEPVFEPTSTLYHPGKGCYHYLCEPGRLGQQLEAIAKEKLYSPETDYDDDEMNDEVFQLFEHNIDLHDFTVFIFRCLREKGYDWQYRSGFLAFAKRVEEGRIGADADDDDEEEVRAGTDPPDDAGANADHSDLWADRNKKHWSEMTFESEYLKFVTEGPEPVVLAYLEAYGVEPDGYPPRMDEY